MFWFYGMNAVTATWVGALVALYGKDEAKVEECVKELREDLELLTPDDLTIGRGRSR